MSPRFVREKIMGAALAAGITGAALHSEEAQAGGYSVESQKQAAHADQVLEESFPGYNFEVTQNPLSVKPDFQIRIQKGDGPWEAGGRVNPPSNMNGAELDGYLTQEVSKLLRGEGAPEREASARRESVESVVESMNITPAAREMISRMGGDPTPLLSIYKGEATVVIKLSNASKDGYVVFDENTASVWLGPGYDNAGNQVLQIKLTNEDGTQESAYWNLDGTFGQ